jgi:hypothetical protein
MSTKKTALSGAAVSLLLTDFFWAVIKVGIP